MSAYIVPYIVLLLCALTDSVKEDRKKYKYRYLFVALAIYFILIGGIRWEIGTDWNEYKNYFNAIKSINFSTCIRNYASVMGVGYLVYTYLIAHIFGNYTIYLIATASLVIISTYGVVYKYSKYPVFSLFGILCISMGYAFAVPRAGIAIALCFVAFQYAYEKKFKKFLLIIWLASVFHNTAIFFILAYYFFNKTFRLKQMVFYGAITSVVSRFSFLLLHRLSEASFIPIAFSARIGYYLHTGNFEQNPTGISNTIVFITRGFFLVIIFAFLWRKRKESRFTNGICNLYIISFLIYIISMNSLSVLSRIAYYYEDVSQFFIISEARREIKNQRSKLIFVLISLLFFSIKYIARLKLGYSYLFVPYKTIYDF